MKIARSIKLLACIISLIWLFWAEKIILQQLLTVHTFSSVRFIFGGALVVFTLITLVILLTLGEIQEWRLEKLLAKADQDIEKGETEQACKIYLKAQRINDHWMNNKASKLLILSKLMAVYQKLGDQKSCLEIDHHIRAIESAPQSKGLEERMFSQSIDSKSEDEPANAKDKSYRNYIISGTFAVALFILGWLLMTPPPGFPLINEILIRLLGVGIITFVVGEALHGRAHGGSGPTAYFQKQAYWFSIRSGFFLFFGISLTCSLGRFTYVAGFWQLPADSFSWFLLIGGLIFCCLVCATLASLCKK